MNYTHLTQDERKQMDRLDIKNLRIDLRDELARNQAAQPANFPDLPNMPWGRYTDPEFYRLEMERLWPKTWMLAGHTGEIPEKGCYKVWSLAGPPVIIVRGADDRVRAFHNVCRHRGGAFAADEFGKVNVFSCRYHGWTYGLDGAFKGMPSPQDFPHLDTTINGLLPVRCETWGNLIFINYDLKAQSLNEHFGPRMTREMADYDFEQRTVYHIARYRLKTNWKYCFDAFLDEYHSYTVHANSFGPSVQQGGVVMSLFDDGHSRFITPMKKAGEDELKKLNPMLNASRNDPRHDLNREAYISYSIFPNLAGAFSENEFGLISMWPQGPFDTLSEVYFMTKPENGKIDQARCETFKQGFGVIMDEDMGNLANIARGLNGGALRESGFNMGYGDRRIHHWHEALDRIIGIDNIPETLRVRQMLECYHEQ